MPTKAVSPVKPRVLLLGRDPTLESKVVAALGLKTCEVQCSADCRQSLDLTCTSHVDVLVLDSNIHSREFSQLASKSRFAERGCRTLVLADSLEQVALASESWVHGVLMKPFEPHHVRTVIGNLLVGARTQALGESWRLDTAHVFDALSPRRDWGINE